MKNTEGTATSTELVSADTLAEIDSVVQECELSRLSQSGKFDQMLKLAGGIKRLRELITDDMMREVIQPLSNSRLGFLTDKDPAKPVWNEKQGKYVAPNPYPLAALKECFIEATLRGARPVGNEFNVLAGGCYLTKEFFQRIVGELDGVTNVEVRCGIPQVGNFGATIRVNVTWKKNGQPDGIKDEDGKPGRMFAIRINKGQGADAITGKATRKALKAAYEQITGSKFDMPDAELGDDVPIAKPVESRVVDSGPSLADRLKEAAGDSKGGDTKPGDDDATGGETNGGDDQTQQDDDNGDQTGGNGDTSDAGEPEAQTPPKPTETQTAAQKPAQSDSKPVRTENTKSDDSEPKPEDGKAAWALFVKRAEAVAKKRKVDVETFDKAMDMCLVRAGWKGKLHKLSPEKVMKDTAELLGLMDSGSFDWKTATVG